MQFIGEAVRKCLSSGSMNITMSRTESVSEGRCRARGGVTRQVETRTVSSFMLCFHVTYFIPSEAKPDVVLKDLAVRQSGVKL